MSSSLKSTLKGFCEVARVNEALVRARRSDLLVLCYHGIVTRSRPDRWSYANWVEADSFRSQLRWLNHHFAPLDLAGLRCWHRQAWMGRKPPVLITFDDGYRNNLTIAAPILREQRVPCLFFLATGFVGTTRVLWNDEVRVRVLHWADAEIAMPSGEWSAVPSELHARRAFSDRVNAECKRLTGDGPANYLQFLRAKTPSVEVMDDPEARAFMTWDEARELARMGFEIGSHTVEHPILSKISRARATAELRESKTMIERELGQSCSAIAYPNGSVHDVDESVIEEVRAAGYDWGFMATPMWQKPGGDPHRISRIGVPGHADLATFKFYASGLHAQLSRPY
jgi:peptidoglycan/xylan/chitin deacetylase (PgdA/CDA1 family)